MNIWKVSYLALRVMLQRRLLWLGGLSLIAVLVAASLAAEFGGRQPATVALDVGISTLRVVLPLFLVFQVQELFSREFERRFYQISLTYPLSRSAWVIGRVLALVCLTGLLLVLITGLLSAEVALVGQRFQQPTPVSLGAPLWLAVLFVALDLLVLLCLACFLAVMATTPSFVLIGTLGFMLIARSYSAMLALLNTNHELVGNAETYRDSLGILGYLLPNLGALDIRMIALYARMDLMPQDWQIVVGNTLFYALGLLALTVWRFQRKQFS